VRSSDFLRPAIACHNPALSFAHRPLLHGQIRAVAQHGATMGKVDSLCALSLVGVRELRLAASDSCRRFVDRPGQTACGSRDMMPVSASVSDVRQIRAQTCRKDAFTQVTALRCRVCKTVGSAYVGSNPTPATTSENAPLAAHTRVGGAFLLCPVMCHLVAPWTVMLRCPRTHSGRVWCR